MEGMGQEVCLDTDVAIGLIKGDKRIEGLARILKLPEAYVSTVTAFELSNRETNSEEVENFLIGIKSLPFDTSSARVAAKVFNAMKKKGDGIEVRDLFIAATCIDRGCALATMNKRHFAKVPGLKLLEF